MIDPTKLTTLRGRRPPPPRVSAIEANNDSGSHHVHGNGPRPSGLWRAVEKGRQRKDDPFWADVWSGDRLIVYGHTPGKEPRLHARAIGLDTGCVYGGTLTAAVFDAPERWTLVSVPSRRR